MDEDEKQINLVDVLTKDALKRAFNKFGIEGTEDMINNLCKNEAMKECFFKNYNNLLGRK